jgi:hypothetical protein
MKSSSAPSCAALPLRPKCVFALTEGQMRACGLSRRKLATSQPRRQQCCPAFVAIAEPRAFTGSRCGSLGPLEKLQQLLVDFLFERRAQAVRGALVNLQGRALDELGLEQPGVGERHNLVVVAL